MKLPTLFYLIIALFSSILIYVVSLKGGDITAIQNITVFAAAFLGSSLPFLLKAIVHKVIGEPKSNEGVALDLMKEHLEKLDVALNHEEMATSKQESIDAIVGVWHQYNLSKKRGEVSWVHTTYNVCSPQDGIIQFEVEYSDKKGNGKVYLYKGLIRDSRTIFIGKSKKENNQKCFIELIPDLTNDTIDIHVGVCYVIDWDGKNTLIPIILSRNPLFENELDEDRLNELCSDSDILNGTTLFPNIKTK